MRYVKEVLKWVYGAFDIVAGLNHFRDESF